MIRNKVIQCIKNISPSRIKFILEIIILVTTGLIFDLAIAVMFGIIIPLIIESVKELNGEEGYKAEDVVAYILGFILGGIIL